MSPSQQVHSPAQEAFLNRELSLLAFNRRVLAQAVSRESPLLERLRFLCIVSSNLDEFFEIRVSGLKERVRLGAVTPGVDGMTSREVLRRVGLEAHGIVADQYALLNDEILPGLAREGVVFLRRSQWNEDQQRWIHDYVQREVLPVLTPVGLDPSHPFPRVLNKSLNFAVELEGQDAFGRACRVAIVQAPRVLPRVIQLPRELSGVDYGFVFLSSMMHAHVAELFPGLAVQGCYQFRVTRNSDLFVDEEEIKNLRTALQGELPQRHFGDAVRLEVADNCPEAMTEFLAQHFGLQEEDVYRTPGIVNLVRLINVPDRVDRPDLKYPPFRPGRAASAAEGTDMFAALRRRDVLLHHPFQSFAPVIEFLRQAADDPQVLAIKMTVYRTGTDSVLMDTLVRAAQKRKEVTAVVELMARFDEEANINWAARLEEVGAHVVYGVFGYKTHAKMLMVVRREEHGLKRYAHLGTGNYHPRTTGIYTDFGLLTGNEKICADVHNVFTQITGLGKAGRLNHLWQAPFTLHQGVIEAIAAEVECARQGRPARIIAKMNSLVEPEVIRALYAASRAGVRIDLVVRGVCALRPGVPGLSERIRVRSVVGRFLEHTRVFYFRADGADKVYLSSADWMERNFFRRIEVCFPILDPQLRRRVIREGLRPYLADNVLAWEMDAQGSYHRRRGRSRRVNVQELLLQELSAP